jgi:hypothetical protein
MEGKMEYINSLDSLLSAMLDYRDLILEIEFPIEDRDEYEYFYSLEKSIRNSLENISKEMHDLFLAVVAKINLAVESNDMNLWAEIDDELIDLYNNVYVQGEKRYFLTTYMTGNYDDIDYTGDCDFASVYANTPASIICDEFDDEIEFEYFTIELEHIAADIREYIDSAKSPVTKEELLRNVASCTNKAIRFAFESGEILNYRGAYYSANQIKISPATRNEIAELMKYIISDQRQHHIEDLYRKIINRFSEFLHNNYIMNANQLFSVVAYLYKEKFNFSWPFFTSKDKSINSEKQLIDSFMNGDEELSVDNLMLFAKEMGIVVPSILRLIKSLEGIAILKNKNEFVLVEDVNISASNILDIERAIQNELITKKCCAIRDLSCVPSFPDIELEWNEWLIFSVVSKWIVDLDVDTTSNQFKHSIPVVSLPGIKTSDYMDAIRERYTGQENGGGVFKAENLDRIDDLIADVLEDELIEIWEES